MKQILERDVKPKDTVDVEISQEEVNNSEAERVTAC